MKLVSKDRLSFILFLAVLYAATGWVVHMATTRVCETTEEYTALRRAMLVLLAPLLMKYILQLGCAPLYSMARCFRERKASDAPLSVSVLIPAWNEEVGIVKTIQSVLDTNYPDLQIVVINDGSTDGTHEIVKRFVADFEEPAAAPASITYLCLANGGKAAAMNNGLLHARGDIVVTVDADSVMAPDALDNLVKCFADSKVAGVAGNVVVANRRKPIEWMQQLEYLYGFFFKRADSLFNSVYIIGGAAAAYRREVLNELGGFDHSIITEDIEMSTRILKHGYKTRYAADAVVYTEGPSELKGLCNQRLRWKYGRLLTFARHRSLFFSLRPGTNPYLSWLLLPLAVYAELLCLATPLLFPVFMVCTIGTHDYMSLVVVIGLLSAVLGMQLLMDPRRRFHSNLILLMPVAWLLFYAVDMVELQALVRSIHRLATRKELRWQKWVRVGILDETRTVVAPS